MESIKIIKSTDNLGRLVIPKRIRRASGIEFEELLEVFIIIILSF